MMRFSVSTFALAGVFFAVAGIVQAPAQQPPKTVKIGVVMPFTGGYAEFGRISMLGIEFATNEINAAGGIKSLQGAKLELLKGDAGASPQQTVSAMRGVLGAGIVAVLGNDISSLTLAGMNLAQQSKIPQLTASFADEITKRDNKYIFQFSAPSSKQGADSFEILRKLAAEHKTPLKKVAFVGENSAAIIGYSQQMRTLFSGAGIDVPVYEAYQPPLPDPTSILARIQQAQPDLIVFGSAQAADAVAVLQGIRRRGVKVPVIGSGVWLVTPGYLKAVGPELLEGVLGVEGLWPLKSAADIEQRFMQATGEPFMNQNEMIEYIIVYTLKAALEKCGCTEPEKVRDTLASLEIRGEIPATLVPGGVIKFNERGELIDSSPVLVQWQKGKPVTVYPPSQAVAPIQWP